MSGDQRLGQAGDVVFAFPQRREVNLERVDPEKQVFAEGPFGHHGLQVAVGRTDDADVDVEEFVFADPPNFARLQESQQHDLHALVEIADFVEEQRAAVGHFDEPFSRRVGPGEGPFPVTEELTFDQVFRQRPQLTATNGPLTRRLSS